MIVEAEGQATTEAEGVEEAMATGEYSMAGKLYYLSKNKCKSMHIQKDHLYVCPTLFILK